MRGAGRKRWLAVLAGSTALGILGACVGDNPDASGGTTDAGGTTETSTDTDGGTVADSGGGDDSGGDAELPRCNPNGTFTEKDVTELNSDWPNAGARLSQDELTVYWHRMEGGDANLPITTIWVAKRSTRDGVFASLQPLVGLNKPVGDADFFPSLLPNGDLIFHSDRNPGTGRDIWISKYENGTFNEPTPFTPLANSGYGERAPYASVDGKEIVLTVDNYLDATSPVTRLAISQEVTPGNYGLPQPITPISTLSELYPVLSADAMTLYFSSGPQMYLRKRADRASPWGPATPVTELNVANASSHPTWVSNDGCVLWFYSNRPANNPVARIFVGTRAK